MKRSKERSNARSTDAPERQPIPIKAEAPTGSLQGFIIPEDISHSAYHEYS